MVMMPMQLMSHLHDFSLPCVRLFFRLCSAAQSLKPAFTAQPQPPYTLNHSNTVEPMPDQPTDTLLLHSERPQPRTS
jgi:hypothetical protein